MNSNNSANEFENELGSAGQKITSRGQNALKAKKAFDKTKSGQKLNGAKKKVAKKATQAAIKAAKWIATAIGTFFGAAVVPILLFLVILIFFLASVGNTLGMKMDDDKWEEYMNSDEGLGEVCKAENTRVYSAIEEEYIKQLKSMASTYIQTFKEYVANGDFPEEVKTAVSEKSWDDEINAITTETTTINLSGSYEVKTGNTSKTEVYFDIPLNLEGLDSGDEYIDTIIGYVEANYAVIQTYTGDNLADLKEAVENKKTVTTKIGMDTPGFEEKVTEEYCTAHGGTVEDGYCNSYTYVKTTKETAKTGTCTFKSADQWENNGEEGHVCSTDEFNKTSSSNRTETVDEISYQYTYIETKELGTADLTDFDLDDFKDEIDRYIASGKLFYFTPEEWKFDGYSVDESERTDKETTTEKVSKSCTWDGTSCGSDECNSKMTGNTGNASGTTAYYDEEVEKEVEIKVTIYNLSSDPAPSVAMHTGIDSDDKDFLYSQKQTAIKNIQELAKAQGETVDGTTEYNENLNLMVETLNFACPTMQINLSLITGGTYSKIIAESSIVDAPGIFGESSYWYDSSKGFFDLSQLNRNDTYEAVWGYNMYLRHNGLISGSNWESGGVRKYNPQCTDFVHTRFYAQYGFDCGNGNGKDVASNTVAKYPDLFTTGTINGTVTIKAGSIVSTTSGGSSPVYGHVGFVEAVETDDSGNIITITISDANFSKLGAPGGVRMHCVYTFEQFKTAWGLNCTFAVPIS